MDISFIIPNFNGEEILKKNLPLVLTAAKQHKKGNVEIIIPDDPSTDRSAEVISAFFASLKDKHIIGKTVSNKNKKEGGFSKNVNRGAKLATGDILILLNSDVSPHKDFLAELLEHFDDPNVFAVGCLDESVENGKIVLRGRGVGRWARGFLEHKLGSLNKTNTLWVSGGSGAFRKSMWDKLGGLNELYNPFYWEDNDLSYRALKMGYKTIFEKKSIVRHEHAIGAIKKHYSEYNKIKVVYRNQFTFVWINITDPDLLFFHFVWLPYHILKALLRKDRAFFWGFIHAIGRIPQIFRYRQNMKKMFTLSDKEILQPFLEEY